jgi:hypothetical protein
MKGFFSNLYEFDKERVYHQELLVILEIKDVQA